MAKAVRKHTTKSVRPTKAKRLLPVECSYDNRNIKICLIPDDGPSDDEVSVTLSANSAMLLVQMIVSLVNMQGGSVINEEAKLVA